MRFFHHTVARSSCVAFALAAVLAATAKAQNSADQPVIVPSPKPLPSASTTPIPYPAYGPADPDAVELVPHPGVPPEVSLPQAVALAVMLSPAFASERAQYDAIRAKYGAEKSALFPAVSIDATATRLYGSSRTTGGIGTGTGGNGGTGGTGGVGGGAAPLLQTGTTVPTTGTPTDVNVQANLQQLIFDGGRVIAAIKSARAADVAGSDTLLRQLQSLEHSVAIAYYNVLSNNATIDSSSTLVREFELAERAVRAQINSGAAPRSNLANAAFQTAQARNTLVTAQGQAIGSQSTFATTIGLDADTQVVPQPVPPDTNTNAPSYRRSVAQGLLLRPDYVAAQNTELANVYNLQFAKLARSPSIVANADAGYGRIIGQESRYTPAQSLGATLTIPIFDQGLTNYNVAVAASQLDQAKAALTLSRLTVESDVRTAVAGLVSARASQVQAQAEVTSARVALDAAQAQFRVGTATIVDVTTAEANLATAQASYITAVYSVHTAVDTYNFAVGLSDLHL